MGINTARTDMRSAHATLPHHVLSSRPDTIYTLLVCNGIPCSGLVSDCDSSVDDHQFLKAS